MFVNLNKLRYLMVKISENIRQILYFYGLCLPINLYKSMWTKPTKKYKYLNSNYLSVNYLNKMYLVKCSEPCPKSTNI